MQILNRALNLAEFFKNLQTQQALIMLDYDGTIAPLLVERMHAYPYPGIKERLHHLMQLKNTRTVIVSGRSLVSLERLLDMPSNLELWGSHGMERKLPNSELILAEISSATQNWLKEGAKACEKTIDIEHYEIKPYSVAIHLRGLPENEKEKII